MDFFSGIDKLTEKSQVSEDGTMVSIPKMEHSEQITASGTSDTESISGKDNEVSVFIAKKKKKRNHRERRAR